MADFSIPLDKLAAKMQADLETVARKATLDLFRSVLLKSPVDTGRFRANWNVGETIDTSTTASTDEARGASEVAKVAALPVGGILYMANSLPYARRLEYEGWSQQAPQGMVRLTAIEYSTYVQKAIGEL
jgi:hypothetical protein